MIALLVSVILAQTPADPPAAAPRPFVITVADEKTGRGVPLVELKTTNNLLYVTDSAGRVAFDEPGLFDQDVFFSVRSFGYEFPRDGFGIRGKALKVVPGGEVTLKIKRLNVAERLYRTTGGGIYRDTILAGKAAPIREPLLNGKVLGQDSIQSVVFGGKILWFWGDTNKPGYPLGNFDMPGATSLLPSRGGLDPDVGVDLSYYVDDKTGFVRGTAKMEGPGPTWLSGLTVLRDPSGRERLFATYEKIRNMLETYRRGLAEWDEGKKEFVDVAPVPLDAPLLPQGHPFLHTVGGVEYVYFASPMPLTRVRATPEAFRDLAQYEAFTPYAPGGRPGKNTVERDASGRVVYGWKKDTSPAGSVDQIKLVTRKALKRSEMLLPICDVADGRVITPHGGSVNWNAYRRRWVAIFVESSGLSPLGEIYYAEADTPLGPWEYARKVATHADGGLVYSFYNPKHHPFLDKDGGRTIFFEGTYTATFSGNTNPTRAYDYNQVLYRLDLSGPDLRLPAAVYELTDAGPAGPFGLGGGAHPERHGRPVAFYAPDRAIKGTVPIFAVPNAAGGQDLVAEAGRGEPLFYAIPTDAKSLSKITLPLLEFVHADGVRHAYSTDPDWTAPGFRRTGKTVCEVWRTTSRVRPPRE